MWETVQEHEAIIDDEVLLGTTWLPLTIRFGHLGVAIPTNIKRLSTYDFDIPFDIIKLLKPQIRRKVR